MAQSNFMCIFLQYGTLSKKRKVMIMTSTAVGVLRFEKRWNFYSLILKVMIMTSTAVRVLRFEKRWHKVRR